MSVSHFSYMLYKHKKALEWKAASDLGEKFERERERERVTFDSQKVKWEWHHQNFF